ncbi:MAG: 50S ribosomal protein L4 [Methanocellales archaeon]
MQAKVLDLEGNVKSEIELPKIFEEQYRPDIIKRAVVAAQANRLQPKGTKPYAGMNTSAKSWGVGHGVSRVPRITSGSRAAAVPQAVGGREAHPPKVEKILEEKINKKERKMAVRSAIAATIDKALVKARGHIFEGELPIVVDDKFEELATTKEVKSVLEKLKLWRDIERVKNAIKLKPGKGKMRGRVYKEGKSLLIVASKENQIFKAARNLPGVDIATPKTLNAELLAPGTQAGRLTLWTESAMKALKEVFA